MNRLALTLFILVVPLTLVFAGAIKDNSLTGSSDGSAIVIRWLSEDESGVVRFELERKAGMTGSFFELAVIAPKGNNSSYEFVDESAFRSLESIYQYAVRVVYANGTSVEYGPITVSHKTSDVRRTWGSIKAMFR